MQSNNGQKPLFVARWRIFRLGIGFCVFAVGCLWAQYGSPTGAINTIRHIWFRHAALTPSFRFEGFFNTSTVSQEINYDLSKNWTLLQEDGRSFLAPADPSQPAFVRVRLKKDFDDYVFFPRVAEGSEVSVCESTPYSILFRLTGVRDWTPLSRRYLLDLRSAEFGEITKQITVELIIILRGRHSQLWLSDGKIFFR